MFKFSMPSMQGSPLSKMGGQQQLQALGAAFGGDQKGLNAILAGMGQGGEQGPVTNEGGEDISAAFGSGQAPPQGGGMGGMMGALGGMVAQAPLGLPMRMLSKRLGFGGR